MMFRIKTLVRGKLACKKQREKEIETGISIAFQHTTLTIHVIVFKTHLVN